VGFAFDGLETAAYWTREAKQAAKEARRVLEAFLLTVDGTFDPDQRRRVGKSFESAALTVWGLPETGPILASHQSWYMDDSVGIPITNAHVVPSEPRTGEPIQTPWELVESAEIAFWSPALMAGYEGGDHPARWAGGRFRTGMIASSDANGMVYLLTMQELAHLRTAFAVI
jgi:acyl-CoA synthetase (AMP-forming)/AMP-acid ligase II